VLDVQAPAPAAEPDVDPFGESDAVTETDENATGSIGNLIGTLRAENARNSNNGDLPSPSSTGGTGEAQ